MDEKKHTKLYKESIANPKEFWDKQAKKFIDWSHPWTKVSDCNFAKGKINWYLGGKLNACYNCLDRHLPTKSKHTALIWEGNTPKEHKTFTYQELFEQVVKMANVLTELGVAPEDRVCIYLPMIPEAVISMLACARIGAVHSVVFGGFSANALKQRIVDCKSKIVITANEYSHGSKKISLKKNVDAALDKLSLVKKVIVVKRTNGKVAWNSKRDLWYHELIKQAGTNSNIYEADSDHPLFILYTSGSTGKPKGILHTTGGYLVYAATTQHYIFNCQPKDIFWCTADVGWITGHTYVVYGPLAIGSTILIYEGVPTYPDPSRLWKIIDKHKVSIFYTAPTLIRALIALGDQHLKTSTRASLRLLGSVGEPINPEAWQWFYKKVGKSNCPIVDTWWQTETGGILISPIPGATKLKPGSATVPFFGIEPKLLDEHGKEKKGVNEGYLVIKNSWPGQLKTIYGDSARFLETYFSRFPGFYLSGDAARRDKDGNYWITGRVDDVINVSGHRLSTSEIESALVKHPAPAEAAVVGKKDDIKGESVCAFVKLMKSYTPNDKLKSELEDTVKKEIGAIAVPDTIYWVEDLPKTRSGKIMRRILRKIVSGDVTEIGDTSTLADQEVVNSLIKHAQKK
jgi:acetyl-CoA synthetase